MLEYIICETIPNDIRYCYEDTWGEDTCFLPLEEEHFHCLSVISLRKIFTEVWKDYKDDKHQLTWLWNTKFKKCNYNKGILQDNPDTEVNGFCFARVFWLAKHNCLCPYCREHVDLHSLYVEHYIKLGINPEFVVKELDDMPLTVFKTFASAYKQHKVLNVFIWAKEYIFIHKNCMSKIFKTNIRRF